MNGMELIPGVPFVVLVIALMQVVKKFNVNLQLVPIIAIIVSVALSFGYAHYAGCPSFEALIRGLYVALSAMGLWSGSKHTIELFKKDH
jgi:predicted RND superfamily exporter protein